MLSYRLIIFSIISLLAIGACGSNSESDFAYDSCQVVNAKIFNGEECIANNSPVVRLKVISNLLLEGLCTGVVIAPRKVLTAAHCVLNAVAVDVVVNGQTMRTISYDIHPEFFANTELRAFIADLAVVTTKDPIPTVPFPILASNSLVIGEEAIIAGYGNQDDSLHTGSAYITEVTVNHIFTTAAQGGANPCQGDSGGPLLVNRDAKFVLAGIVSSGTSDIGCGLDDTTLYTNLSNSSVLDFVFSHAPSAEHFG